MSTNLNHNEHEMKLAERVNLLLLKLHYGARHRLALIFELRQQFGFVFQRRLAFLQSYAIILSFFYVNFTFFLVVMIFN